MHSRIRVIDGFRAIAILGVLWAHIWMFFGNPVFLIKGKDISPLFSFWGTGVDLFFVISGFCMYLMQFSKKESLSVQNFFAFLKKRFIRIAPAFYAAIILYGIYNVIIDKEIFNYKFAITNILFLNTLTNIKGYAPHFWSLNTEWHFYFFLPLLMVLFKKNAKRNILFLLLSILAFRMLIWVPVHMANDFENYSIPNRLIEFLFGMILCKFYVENKIPKFANSPLFFIVGFFISFVGRVLMSSAFNQRNDFIGYFSRVFDLPLLSLGFAIMIMATLNSKNAIAKFIGNKFFLFIGKYSYSMYLWHWLFSVIVTNYVKKYSAFSNFVNVNIAFVLSVIVLIPISILSYQLFELFYFKVFSKKQIATVKI